jgi:hypothetical protein
MKDLQKGKNCMLWESKKKERERNWDPIIFVSGQHVLKVHNVG